MASAGVLKLMAERVCASYKTGQQRSKVNDVLTCCSYRVSYRPHDTVLTNHVHACQLVPWHSSDQSRSHMSTRAMTQFWPITFTHVNSCHDTVLTNHIHTCQLVLSQTMN